MGQSETELELEREVFKRLPEWCKTLLSISPKYKHLYNSNPSQNLPKIKK